MHFLFLWQIRQKNQHSQQGQVLLGWPNLVKISMLEWVQRSQIFFSCRYTLIQNETVSFRKSKFQNCSESKMTLITFVKDILNRVSHTLNNRVDGVSDEAYYPWESPKKI